MWWVLGGSRARPALARLELIDALALPGDAVT